MGSTIGQSNTSLWTVVCRKTGGNQADDIAMVPVTKVSVLNLTKVYPLSFLVALGEPRRHSEK